MISHNVLMKIHLLLLVIDTKYILLKNPPLNLPSLYSKNLIIISIKANTYKIIKNIVYLKCLWKKSLKKYKITKYKNEKITFDS